MEMKCIIGWFRGATRGGASQCKAAHSPTATGLVSHGK